MHAKVSLDSSKLISFSIYLFVHLLLSCKLKPLKDPISKSWAHQSLNNIPNGSN